MKKNNMKMWVDRTENFDVLSVVNSGVDQLQPLADTMSKALKAVGIAPSTDINELVNQFHTNISNPNAGVTNAANMVNNVVGYFQEQLGAYKSGAPLSNVETIVAKGANTELLKIGIQKKIVDFVSANPLIVVGVLILLTWAAVHFFGNKK